MFLKMCDGTLTGNQSMGVLLLLGVITTFASTVPWLLPPSEVTAANQGAASGHVTRISPPIGQVICAVRHFLHPLAFCLCFGLLLLKVMQLRSLVSVGLGGTIPQVYIEILSTISIIYIPSNIYIQSTIYLNNLYE